MVKFEYVPTDLMSDGIVNITSSCYRTQRGLLQSALVAYVYSKFLTLYLICWVRLRGIIAREIQALLLVCQINCDNDWLIALWADIYLCKSLLVISFSYGWNSVQFT